jgi:Kdo2-lipid IVA lauroyltransferase/acyltransferase
MGHLIQYWLLRLLTGLLQGMPLHVVRRIARALADFLFHVIRARKSVVVAQLSASFPEKDASEINHIAHQAYVNICTTFLELFWSPKLEPWHLLRGFRVENVEVLLNAHARGRGVLLLSGHYGNWEWIPHVLQAKTGLNGAAIARPMQNSYVDRLVNTYRTQFGGVVIPMERAGREGFRLLKNGGILMVLTDQSAPHDALFLPFFGRLTTWFKGTAVFQLKTGASLIMVTSYRQDDGNYLIRLDEIPVDNLPADFDEAVDELTRRHVKALENIIRERPGDWFWHHRRWKHAPTPNSRIVGDRPA